MTEQTEDRAPDLVAQLVQANYNAYASTTQTLIDSLTEQVADLQAERDAVREGVAGAFEGPYMPTPERVRSLLYPAPETIALYRRENAR